MPKIESSSKITNKPKFLLLVLSFCTLLFFSMYVKKNYDSPNTSTEINKTEIIQNNKSPNTEESNWTCSICGKEINGRGYQETFNGVWRPCEEPYQCQICSPACGRKHNKNSEKIEESIEKSTKSRCKNCNLGYYQNGFCDRCGGASQERVNESRSKLSNCSLCRGTGIEKPMGRNINNEVGRICPACDGTGKESY